jgi:glucokinase
MRLVLTVSGSSGLVEVSPPQPRRMPTTSWPGLGEAGDDGLDAGVEAGPHVHHLGIDIGGGSAKVSLVDDDSNVHRTAVVELVDRSDDPGANRAARVEVVARAISRAAAAGTPAATVTVATPGIVDAAHRRIVSLPGKLAWAGGRGLDVGARTARARTAIDVSVLNDAHAAVLGEARLGAGRGALDIAMLTLGTGVGGGVVLGGRLLEGRNRRAGHLGHISLDPYGAPSVFPTPGSLEWHVGDAYAGARTDGRYASNEAIVAAARGEAAGTAAWGRMMRALAVAIASIVNVFDCERVILGGGLVAAGTLLFDPLERELAEVEWRPGGIAVAGRPGSPGSLLRQRRGGRVRSREGCTT